MVYKKYVYKKGKKFGPYYYESYRVGNKIKKRYLGSDLASETPSPLISNKLAYVFIALGLVALIVLAFYFINFNTGRVVLQISESYSLGEQITGNLNLLLKNGELIPADSIVKIKLNGQEKTISLSSLVTDDKASGNLYAENSQLQGQGEGFGVPGKKTSYPDVDFSLLISKNEELAEIQQPPAGIPIIETPTETTETPATEPTVSETSTSETTEIQTPAQTESLTSAPTTESNPVPETPAPSAVEASSITAQVIKENKNKKEVPGKASKNQNFVYQLKEGETAEIKKNSVSVDGKKVDDNIVSLSISGTSAEIKTDYSEDELGFGQDYLQAETTSLIINLENFNITAEQGTLEVSLVYDNLEIIKASKEINIKLEENETEVVPEIPEENITIITNVTNVGVVEINITNVTLPEINLTNVTLPETNITNITIEQNATNLSIQTIQYSAVIGKPVRWKKVINKPENENLIVELPKETTNVSVKKIEQVDENKDITKEVKISGITGAVIGTNQNNWLRNLFRLTGRVTQEENENASDAVQVEIPENSTNVEIEYYTPAPESSEENITNGKIIFISGPELNYTNILAYTKVPEEWKIKTSNHNQISLSWIEDGNESLKQQWKFQAFDSDNNSLVDYIEWNVPHLSNQIFELNNLSSSSVSSDVKCEGGGAYCHLITDNDLILYYPFDVANISSTEYDWSRSNNNGVYTGIAHWVSSPNGKYGGAYNSSGVTQGYLNGAGVTTGYNFTMLVWVKLIGTIDNSDSIYGKPGTPYKDFNFYGSKLRWFDNGIDMIVASSSATAGLWQHWAIRSNDTGMTLYFQGNQDVSTNNYHSNITSNTDLGIGIAGSFGGYIDEFMIFNRSLSATEISQIYNEQFPRFYSSGNLTLNQSITLGYNAIDITTLNNNQNGTNISLSVCHATGCTLSQNMTNGTRQTFTISSPTSILYLNFSFISDGYNFWSPILLTNVSVNVSGETAPLIYFTSPTPPSGRSATNNQMINVSIEEANLQQFIWNWNSTNYTFYDKSLLVIYNFNNNSLFGDNATSVIDLSWQSRNGTMLGNAYMNATGKYFGGLQLDGTEDYVSTPIYPLKNNFTLEMWINPGVMGAKDEWASSSTGSGVSGFYWHNNYDTNDFNYVTMELISGSWTSCKGLAVGSITTNQWHHVAFTKSSTTGVRIFYDGANVSACTAMTGDIIDEGTSLFLGRGYPDSNNRYLQGALDEAKLWNRTLTDSEIKQSYLSNLAKINSTLWLFATSPNLTLGQNNTYQAFAKNSLGIENSTELRELNITLPLRITMVSPLNQTYGVNYILFNLTLNSEGDACKFSLDSWATNYSMTKLTTINFNFTNSSIADGSYGVVFWCNDTIGLINDTAQIGFTVNTKAPILYFTSPTPPSGRSATNNQMINVSIEEANLQQFIWNWNSTNYTFYNESLLLMYNFDNISSLGENSTYVVDVSSYSNNGVLIGGALWNSSGKYLSALSFDGVNDYISLGDANMLENINFTIGMWVYPKLNAKNHEDGLIAKTDTGSFGYSFYVGNQPSALTTKNVQFLYGDGVAWRYTTGTSVLVDGKWYYLVVTYQNKNVSIYVNGTLETSSVFANALSIDTNAPVVIGQGWQDNNRFWNGSIDEVRIWNRSLTANEVYQSYISNLERYNSTLWQFTSNQSSLNYGYNYTYQAFAKNSPGLTNSTELRELNITLPLRITMVSPLNQTYSTSSILFNVSLNNDGDTCKFSLDNWLTNITMTKLTTTNFNFTNSSIADGSYTSKFWCNDTIGSVNYTTSIDFSKDASNPLIYFTNPTPPSGINYSNSHIINITIIEKDLSQFIWNWNSTNYTYYNNSLLVMLGFNNFSGIGDNLTNVADSSLYSQNGTLMGNAFFNCTSGMFGCAIDLDGTGDWVNVSYKGGYNSIQFSVCAWAFKKVNVSHASIASDYVNGGGGRNFILGYEYPDNTLAFGFGDGTAFDWIYGNYSEKKWHYVCGVFNNFTHELSIYIDSVNNTKITFINKSGGIPSVVTAVGKYTELFYFNGLIDEFRIWNRSLTSLEIQEMYNSNLYKYNSTLWMFTSNHTNLAWGSNRTYQAFAYDIYGNSNSTEMRELNISLLQALDTFYPQFNSYQVSPANNSAYLAGLLNFNTTILQTNGTAGIQFNGVNYSMINSSSQDIFNKTLGTIGVGDYVYYFWAYGNGTSGLYNTTQLFEYTIAKRDATYGLNITGTTPIGYPQVTNVDKSENNTEDIDCIYAVDIANDLFGVDASPITFNYSTAGCSNYTAGSITKAITITQNTTQTSLTFDKTSPQSYPTLITPTCSFIQGAGTLSLANGTSGVASQLGADTWYFNCSFIGDNNYTASSNFTSFTITQNSTYVFAITGTTPIIYGTISDVAGSGCPSELSCSMDMDNVVYGVEVSPLEFNYSTAGNNNYSANSITKDITINKGTQSLTALLNGASDNVTGTYPYPMNFSFSGTNYTAVKIYVNQLEVTPHINYTYGGGSYIINYSASSNQNYSAYNYWLNFTIQQASQTPISLLNGVENNLTLTYPTQINASFYNNDTEMIVSIANQIITPHLNYTYGSSHYVVNFTAISNQNYSEFIYFMNFTINKASSQTSLIFDKTTPQDYGTSITPTCSIFIGGNEALSLTNGTSGLAETLGVGAWNFNCSYAGNTNYSANSNFTTFTINQANSPITLLINGTAGNQTAPFGAGTNVSAYINNNEQTIFLLNNSIDSTNSNHLFNTLGIGSYNFTAYVDASQNYSYQTLTRWSHILDVTPPMVAILGPTNTTYNYSVINLNITNSSDAQAVWYMNSTGNFSYTIPLYFNLTNGAYTLFAYANDSVNNVNETKVSFYVNYTAPDTTAPDIYIDSPRNITYSFTNMSLNVTSTFADINLWWFSLDNGLNNYSFTPNSTINGSEGSNSLLVWNNDTSNNINISSVNFTIDTIKPNITLISPSNGISSVNSAYNFTFNVSDNSEISNCGLIVDDALAGTLTGVSKDYQNGIYYSGLVVGSHTWQINCTDSAGNLENSSARSLIVTSPPVPPVTPTGGGGGGAGIVFKLKANPEFINLQSVVNSRINGTLDITNLGSSTVYLTINLIKLDGLLEMQKTLTLASGETKTLEYFVNSPKDAGIYTGKIRFAYAENSLEVPFALNVKTEISLFDISVNLPKEYKSITKGQNLKAQINLIQAGLQDKADVTVVYMIKDFESNTYLQESETMMVYKEKAYEKEFQIGTFEPGNYVIGAEVIYSGGVAAASSNFDVVGKKPFSFWMLLVVIATFIIIVVVAVRYKKIVADRINNKSKLKKRV